MSYPCSYISLSPGSSLGIFVSLFVDIEYYKFLSFILWEAFLPFLFKLELLIWTKAFTFLKACESLGFFFMSDMAFFELKVS